jgi:hypothetical protein
MIEQENSHLPEKEEVSYDAIFVLPAYPYPEENIGLSPVGIVERIAGLPRTKHSSGLLFDTRLRVLAAWAMAKEGNSKTIITMSRKIRPWMRNSYASLMERAIIHRLPKSPELKIIKEENSYDLLSGVEQIESLALDKSFGKVAIISDSIQKQRVKKLIKSWGKFPEHDIVTMEDVLMNEYYTGERSVSFTRIIEKLHNSPFWSYWKLREGFAEKFPKLASTISQKTR